MNEEMDLEALAERMSGDSSAPSISQGCSGRPSTVDSSRGAAPSPGPAPPFGSVSAHSPSGRPAPARDRGAGDLPGIPGCRGHRPLGGRGPGTLRNVSALETNLLKIAFPRITRRIVDDAAKILDLMDGEQDCIRRRDLNQMFHNLLFESADRPPHPGHARQAAPEDRPEHFASISPHAGGVPSGSTGPSSPLWSRGTCREPWKPSPITSPILPMTFSPA